MVARVVLDTNILVSAFRFNKDLLRLVETCLADSSIQVFSSPDCYSELMRVLTEKFELSEAVIAAVENTLKRVKIVNPRVRLQIVRDATDDKFVEAAVEAKAEYIISGDKDLLVLGSYQGIKIVSAMEFVGVLEGR